MTRQLIINADDLGLAESVNRGIIESIEHGVVTSASLMVNLPACADAIRRLGELPAAARARIGVGLHFNIVAGQPLTECESLTDARSGEFLSLVTLALKSFGRGVSARDVQRELDAQLEKARTLLATAGMRVTHIDSHQHAHCLPTIFDLVTRTAARHGIGHVRHPYERRGLIGGPLADVTAIMLRALLSSHAVLDDVEFTGLGAMRSRAFGARVATLVDALPEGATELMVHPGYDSPELAAIDGYRAPRERELRALTQPELRERIRAAGVELTHFGARATTPPASAPTPEAREAS